MHAPRDERVSRTTRGFGGAGQHSHRIASHLALHRAPSATPAPSRVPAGVLVPGSEPGTRACGALSTSLRATTSLGARSLVEFEIECVSKLVCCCTEWEIARAHTQRRTRAARPQPESPIWRAVDHDQQRFSVVSKQGRKRLLALAALQCARARAGEVLAGSRAGLPRVPSL